MKYGKYTLGQIEAIINKLGGEEGADALLRDELIIQPKLLPFPKNKNGHYIVTVTGLGLSGREEIGRLEEGGFRINDYARQILLSTNSDSYDANHRLENGREYVVAIVPGKELKENRTTANLQAYAARCGYEKPLAGIVPRLREVISDRQMEQMDIWYIAGLHDPTKDSDDVPYVLSADRIDDGQWLSTDWVEPDFRWDVYGAFAFLVPQVGTSD